VAGKVTVGLASHWPCVTHRLSGIYPPTGSMNWESEMSTPRKFHIWSTTASLPLPLLTFYGLID